MLHTEEAFHVTPTRHAHQVTACALHILLRKAYDVYVESLPQGPPQSFSCWCIRRKDKHPQFLYWYTTLELELDFVRSLSIGDFDLYVDILTKLTPWFFSLNQINYSRWMSVHVKDTCSLDTTLPDVAQEFRKGKFALAKSSRKFSLIAIEHGHEQNNGVMKDENDNWTDTRCRRSFAMGCSRTRTHSRHF